MSSNSFQLDVKITRPDVVEWLRAIPPDCLPQKVENTLAAGNMVLTMIEAGTGEQSMQRFFRPVLEPMGQLQETIGNILRGSQKSQKIGELGEQIVAQQMKAAFPCDEFLVVSHKDHQADIHASFAVNDHEARKALIEVKLHSNDVPSAELEKFRRDLKSSGFKFGLMVSLSSRLTGICGPLHLEETPDYVAIFLPDAGLDGYRLLCAVAMLKALILYQARTARLIPTGAIEQAWARLNAEMQELKEIADEVRDLRGSLQSSQQELAGMFGRLAEKAISSECRMRHALSRITNRLAEELTQLPRTSGHLALPVTEADSVLAFLEHLRLTKDPRHGAFLGMFDLIERLGLLVSINEGHWQLQMGSQVVAWTEGTKTRLDACVPSDFAIMPEVTLDTRLEKVKNDHIVISGSEPEQMLGRLEARLAASHRRRAIVEEVRRSNKKTK